MRQIRDSITASFEDFDFAVKALDKAAGSAADDVICLIYKVPLKLS